MNRSTEVALLLTATDRASAVVNALTANAGKKLSGIATIGNRLKDIGPKMMIVGDAVTNFFKDTVKEAQYANAQYAILEKTMANLGDKKDKTGKGIVAQELAQAADDFEKKTGLEAEAVMRVQQNLALYKSVISKASRDNGTFNKAVELAFDMQAKGFGDAAGNAKMLGKALENPTKNIAKLEKAGILFTDAEKKKAAALVSTGKKAEAQQLILDKVAGKVAGAAQAAADPMAILDANIGDLKETIGSALLPTVIDLTKKFVDFIKPVGVFLQSNPRLIKSIAAMGVAFLVVGKTITIVSALFTGGPWMIAIKVIALLAGVIIANWDKIGPFFSKLWGKVTGFFSSAWKGIKTIFLNYTPYGLIFKHWDKISGFFSGLWSGIKTGVKAGWSVIKAIFWDYTPPVLIYKHWDKIASFFTGIWDNVKGVFKGWIDWVFGLGGRMVEAGGNIVTSIWEGIKGKAQVLIDGVKNIAQKVRDFFPFSPAKAGPLRDIHKIKLVETIAQSVNAAPLMKSMQGLTNKVFNYNPQVPAMGFAGVPERSTQPGSFAGRSSGHSFTYAPNITLAGSATEQDGASLNKMMKQGFDKLMREYEAKQQRKSIRG